MTILGWQARLKSIPGKRYCASNPLTEGVWRYAATIILVNALLLLAACDPAPAPSNDSGLQAITLVPTVPTATPAPTRTSERALVTATPDQHACAEDEVATILRAMPDYVPGDGAFITVAGDGFTLYKKPFVPRGVNYYPANAPWQRFPTADLATIEADFALLHATHTNTVRVFLWYPPLFTCPGSGAVPDPDAFRWLDSLIQAAHTHDLRLIVTLHHLPDLRIQPIYTDPGAMLAQTAFIVSRYRDEPTILAWDVRDAGDADYTSIGDQATTFSREQVLEWLARTITAIRSLDPNHPITAGWATDSEATISLVDVVSFQFFGEDETQLRRRVADLRAYTDKPLLLIAFGMSTFVRDETEQADTLREAIRAAELDNLAGWLIWTMYDFPTSVTCWPDPCASFDDARHHFGLWRVDGSRKAAVEVLTNVTKN